MYPAARLRRATRILSAVCRRISSRLKSPDCLLCIFTCTFVYVLCFIFILAVVIRSSGGGSGSQVSRLQLHTTMQQEDRGPGLDDAAVGGSSSVGDSSSDLMYERRFVDDIIVEEGAFSGGEGRADDNATGDSQGPPQLLDPEVLTDTSQLVGVGSQDFGYPLQVDMPDLLQRLRSGRPASVRAINTLEAPWQIGQSGRCTGGEFLVLLVKSHPANVANRQAIRATWGNSACWRRRVVLLFVLGADAAYGVRRGRRVVRRLRDWRAALSAENSRHRDLLVREFVDHYYNNTLKLMSGLQWSVRECRGAKFTAFVDDDFFVNPYQVERQLDSLSASVYGRFLGGWVWRTSLPRRRTRRRRSKWDISFSEYPWATYPPYVAAGAMFMSQPVLKDISVAMQYTKYLRFDDIFIGLVAHKLLLTPLHMELVRAYEPVAVNSTDMPILMRLVASHGYRRPSDVTALWQRLHLGGLCTNGEPDLV